MGCTNFKTVNMKTKRGHTLVVIYEISGIGIHQFIR